MNDDILDFFKNPLPKNIKVLGVSDESEYFRLVNKIYKKANHMENCIFVENNFPLIDDIATISYIKSEVDKMDIFNLIREEIVLCGHSRTSARIKDSICKNWKIALSSPLFLNIPYINDNIRKNVLSSYIVTIFNVLKNFNFDSDTRAKLVYYGHIDNNNALILKILSESGINVMFINSFEDNEILDFHPYNFNYYKPLTSISELSEKAIVLEQITIDKVETVAKNYKDGLGLYLYDGITTFRNRQLFHLDNKVVHIDSVIEDIKIYWNEENRFRPAFKVSEDVVYTPSFFVKINGVYSNKLEYKTLISTLTESPQYGAYTLKIKMNDLLNYKIMPNSSYDLVYAIKNLIIAEDILRESKSYLISNYSNELQNRIIRKFNEFMFKNGLKFQNYKLEDFILLLLNFITAKNLMKLLENFDYPFKVCKLVVFEDKAYEPTSKEIIMLEFLNTLGIDIVIISPYGNCFIENNLKSSNLSTFTLDVIDENFEINQLSSIKEKNNFFKKVFKNINNK